MRFLAATTAALFSSVACSPTGAATVVDAGSWGEGGPQCAGSYVIDMRPGPPGMAPASACDVAVSGVRIHLDNATGAATVSGAPTITLPCTDGGSFGAGLTFGETDCASSEFPCEDGASVGCGYQNGYDYSFGMNVDPSYHVTGTAGVGCVAYPAPYNCACAWTLTGTFSPN